MNSSIIVTGVIVLVIFLIPIILIQRSNKKDRKDS